MLSIQYRVSFYYVFCRQWLSCTTAGPGPWCLGRPTMDGKTARVASSSKKKTKNLAHAGVNANKKGSNIIIHVLKHKNASFSWSYNYYVCWIIEMNGEWPLNCVMNTFFMFGETQELMQHQLLPGWCWLYWSGWWGKFLVGNNLQFFCGVIYVGPVSPVCCCSLPVCWEWLWCLE